MVNLKQDEFVITKNPNQLVPEFDRISLISLLKNVQLMTTNVGTNSKDQQLQDSYLRSFFGTISKHYNWMIIKYLQQHGAVTSLIVRRRLNIPRRSAFRALSELEDIGAVELATRAKVPNSVGKPGNVYCLIGGSIEDVRRAVKTHNLLYSSKKYRIADNLAQTILEEFKEKPSREMHYRDIMSQVKKLQIPFSSYDISQMVYKILVDNDMKVWM